MPYLTNLRGRSGLAPKSEDFRNLNCPLGIELDRREDHKSGVRGENILETSPIESYLTLTI